MAGNGTDVVPETSQRDDRCGGADVKPAPRSDVFEGLTPLQRAKAVAVAKKARDRADAPPMTLAMKGDVLQVSFEHENPIAVEALAMSDLGTCDPYFHVAVIGPLSPQSLHQNSGQASAD